MLGELCKFHIHFVPLLRKCCILVVNVSFKSYFLAYISNQNAR